MFYSHHVVCGTLVGLPLEVHGGFGVGDGAVLFVPVVVLDHGRDPVRVHEDVTAKEGGLHVPINQPVQLKVLVVVAERVDQLFSNLKHANKNVSHQIT